MSDFWNKEIERLDARDLEHAQQGIRIAWIFPAGALILMVVMPKVGQPFLGLGIGMVAGAAGLILQVHLERIFRRNPGTAPMGRLWALRVLNGLNFMVLLGNVFWLLMLFSMIG